MSKKTPLLLGILVAVAIDLVGCAPPVLLRPRDYSGGPAATHPLIEVRCESTGRITLSRASNAVWHPKSGHLIVVTSPERGSVIYRFSGRGDAPRCYALPIEPGTLSASPAGQAVVALRFGGFAIADFDARDLRVLLSPQLMSKSLLTDHLSGFASVVDGRIVAVDSADQAEIETGTVGTGEWIAQKPTSSDDCAVTLDDYRGSRIAYVASRKAFLMLKKCPSELRLYSSSDLVEWKLFAKVDPGMPAAQVALIALNVSEGGTTVARVSSTSSRELVAVIQDGRGTQVLKDPRLGDLSLVVDTDLYAITTGPTQLVKYSISQQTWVAIGPAQGAECTDPKYSVGAQGSVFLFCTGMNGAQRRGRIFVMAAGGLSWAEY